jgi:dTDP-glucose pyrophosphorylase
MECARDAIGREDFILMLGDEILLNPRHERMLAEFSRSGIFALCGVLSVDDKDLIRRTYTIIHDGKGTIHRLVEKPRTPLNDIMGTGQCVFKNAIFDYLDITPIHHERKEKELPDLVQCAIDDGKVVRAFDICDKYTNINTSEDIEMAEGFFK